MLSQDLQAALDAAFKSAKAQSHDLLTVEHLLLALLDDVRLAEVLRLTTLWPWRDLPQ